MSKRRVNGGTTERPGRPRSGGLSEADRSQWEKVAATVRPLRTSRPAPRPEPQIPEGRGQGSPAEHGKTRPEPASSLTSTGPASARPRPSHGQAQVGPGTSRADADAATLDGGWDRRIRSGRVAPDLVVDLHGHSRDSARTLLRRRLLSAASSGGRVALVITGKGSSGMDRPQRDSAEPPGAPRRGVIREMLPHWLSEPDIQPLVAALRTAHPRHGGGGAWYVILRRQKAR
jgi:DNA-nicking Smr family endonuclease